MRNPADSFASVFTYDLISSDTIKTLVGDYGNSVAATALTIMDEFKKFSAGAGLAASGTNTSEPIRLRLYNNDGANWDMVGDLNLKNEKVVFYASSSIKIQNRTQSDAATNLANDITHNPVKGKCFNFTGPIPKLKIETGWQMEVINALNGVNLQRGATFSSTGQDQIPSTNIFRNLKSSTKLSLDPGQLQEMPTIVQKGTKTFHNFLRGLHIGPFNNTQTNMSFGKSQLVTVMDELNFAKTAKITVVYEVHRQFKCYMKTGKTDPAQGLYIQYTSSNVTV